MYPQRVHTHTRPYQAPSLWSLPSQFNLFLFKKITSKNLKCQLIFISLLLRLLFLRLSKGPNPKTKISRPRHSSQGYETHWINLLQIAPCSKCSNDNLLAHPSHPFLRMTMGWQAITFYLFARITNWIGLTTPWQYTRDYPHISNERKSLPKKREEKKSINIKLLTNSIK